MLYGFQQLLSCFILHPLPMTYDPSSLELAHCLSVLPSLWPSSWFLFISASMKRLNVKHAWLLLVTPPFQQIITIRKLMLWCAKGNLIYSDIPEYNALPKKLGFQVTNIKFDYLKWLPMLNVLAYFKCLISLQHTCCLRCGGRGGLVSESCLKMHEMGQPAPFVPWVIEFVGCWYETIWLMRFNSIVVLLLTYQWVSFCQIYTSFSNWKKRCKMWISV